MRITYKYKLKPNTAQIATFSKWLELCRRQYNFRLGQRFDWYEATRSRVDACPIVSSIVSVEEVYKHIPLTRTLVKGKRKGEEVSNILDKGYVDWFNVQRADLKQTKTLFPDYKALDSQGLQDVIDRVETAFQRFTTPDVNGNRSGKLKIQG